MRAFILIAILAVGCSVAPVQKVDSADNEMRQGITGDPPDVRPVGRAERIDRGYENQDLH